MAAIPVTVALRSSREGEVCAAIDAHPRLTVHSRCADLSEAVGAIHAGVSIALLSEQPHLTRDVIADLQARSLPIAVAETPEESARLRIVGVERIVELRDPQAIADYVAEAATRNPASQTPVRADAGVTLRGDGDPSIDPESQPTRGRRIVVWGPTGAPGRTTVAVNLGAALARRGSHALVVDADTYGGAVAQACGMLDESAGLAGLARTALSGSVSDAAIATHSVTVGDNLAVVTGITRPHRWSELPAAALDVVWEAAARCADDVVIDVGFGLAHDEELTYDTHAPQRNDATLSALRAADAVIAVGTAEPLGIQRLIHGLEALAEHASAPIVVVNRVRRDVAGPRPEQTIADALTRYAGVSDAWMLPWDPSSADAATLAGRLLRESAPRGRLTRAIAALAAHVDSEVSRPLSARTPVIDPTLLTH